MVVLGVPENRHSLSPIIISFCLSSCSLGAGWWCRGSQELASSCLPSKSARVSLLVAWEPDGGPRGLGKSPVFVSHHIFSFCLYFCSLEPDGGAGQSLSAIRICFGLSSCSLGTGWWCGVSRGIVVPGAQGQPPSSYQSNKCWFELCHLWLFPELELSELEELQLLGLGLRDGPHSSSFAGLPFLASCPGQHTIQAPSDWSNTGI